MDHIGPLLSYFHGSGPYEYSIKQKLTDPLPERQFGQS